MSGGRRSFEEYATAYEHVAMRREDGILEMTFHSDGGPLVWGALPHEELGYAFAEAGSDRTNRVIIITGAGDAFCAALDDSWVGPMTPVKWDTIHANGRRLLDAQLAIEVPVVAVVNGPARVHAEIAVLADIVIAAETAVFQDAPHFRKGTVPGDGVHAIWPALLGPNRGRVFLLTAQRITAREALELGVVAEVVAPERALDRGWEVACGLAEHDDVTLRLTRAALTQQLRRLLTDTLHHGLALEGLGAHATWPRA